MSFNKIKRRKHTKTFFLNEKRLNMPLSVHSWVRFFFSCSVFFSVVFFVVFSSCFFLRFWLVLGAILEPSWSPNRVKMQLMLEQRVCAIRWFWCFFGMLVRFVFCIDFLLFFCSIWGSFWEGLGGLLGAQIGHFGHRFFDDFCMSFQDRPRVPQESPKERPKSTGEARTSAGRRRL